MTTATFTPLYLRISDRAIALRGYDTWVSLADIRNHFPDATPSEWTEAFKALNRLEDVHIVPEENQKTLTQADWDAAVVIGGQAKHWIMIRF